MLYFLYTFAIVLFILIILYILIYPHVNCIYTDKLKNKVKIINVNKFTVVLVYILDDGQEITSPQNWDLLEFINTFKLWKNS